MGYFVALEALSEIEVALLGAVAAYGAEHGRPMPWEALHDFSRLEYGAYVRLLHFLQRHGLVNIEYQSPRHVSITHTGRRALRTHTSAEDSAVRAALDPANVAGRYFARRARLLKERAALAEEWHFLGRALGDDDVVDRVPVGWRALALELHRRLLELDDNYRLRSVAERRGRLQFIAVYGDHVAEAADLLVAATRAKAAATCIVCRGRARLRRQRPTAKTLCDPCLAADQALAAERGRTYADAALACLTSGDADHPSAEEIVSWLGSLAE